MGPFKSLLFKTACSNNKTYLVFSAGRKTAVNYSEVRTLEEDAYRDYFLPMQCIRNGRKNKIRYDISGYSSVSELLRSEIRQDQYFQIIAGIQEILSFCQKAHFSVDDLVCDPKYVYFHNVRKKIMMVYVPLDKKKFICDDIPKCLRKMRRMAKITVSDHNYLNKYDEFINSFRCDRKNKGSGTFTPAALRHFLNTNNMVGFEYGADQLQTNNADINDEARFPISSQLAGNENVVKDNVQAESNTIVRRRGREVFLTDKDGNRFDICQFPFTIGRNKKMDLVIDKPTVSGEHAAISLRDGKFFITDSSSNGTFLNDGNNRISSCELHSGDSVFFDSFCFKFTVSGDDESSDSSARTVVVARKNDMQNNAAAVNDPDNSRAEAYLKKSADNSVINISSFPFVCGFAEGVVIKRDSSGKNCLFIENNSGDALSFEGIDIPSGQKAELFSGCSLTIAGEKYSFMFN